MRVEIGDLKQQLTVTQNEVVKLESNLTPENKCLTQLRAVAVRELAKLLPIAIKNARAKGGSPALLRLILRSLKSL